MRTIHMFRLSCSPGVLYIIQSVRILTERLTLVKITTSEN